MTDTVQRSAADDRYNQTGYCKRQTQCSRVLQMTYIIQQSAAEAYNYDSFTEYRSSRT